MNHQIKIMNMEQIIASELKEGMKLVSGDGCVFPIKSVEQSKKNISVKIDTSDYYLSFRTNEKQISIKNKSIVNILN